MLSSFVLLPAEFLASVSSFGPVRSVLGSASAVCLGAFLSRVALGFWLAQASCIADASAIIFYLI